MIRFNYILSSFGLLLIFSGCQGEMNYWRNGMAFKNAEDFCDSMILETDYNCLLNELDFNNKFKDLKWIYYDDMKKHSVIQMRFKDRWQFYEFDYKNLISVQNEFNSVYSIGKFEYVLPREIKETFTNLRLSNEDVFRVIFLNIFFNQWVKYSNNLNFIVNTSYLVSLNNQQELIEFNAFLNDTMNFPLTVDTSRNFSCIQNDNCINTIEPSPGFLNAKVQALNMIKKEVRMNINIDSLLNNTDDYIYYTIPDFRVFVFNISSKDSTITLRQINDGHMMNGWDSCLLCPIFICDNYGSETN